EASGQRNRALRETHVTNVLLVVDVGAAVTWRPLRDFSQCAVLERCDKAGSDCPQSIVSLPCPRISQPLLASENGSGQPLVHGALRGRSQLPSSLLLTQERFSEQRRYEFIEKQEQLRPRTDRTSGFAVEWHDGFRRHLPAHGHVGQAGIQRGDSFFAARRNKRKLNERYKLV